MDIPVSLFDSFEIDKGLLPATPDEQEKFRVFRLLLIQRIEALLQRDFEKLKWILYRIDVSEKKLSEALERSEADAATVMADMIIKTAGGKGGKQKKFGGNENDWNFDV